MSISDISRHRGTVLLLGEHEGNFVMEALSDRAERPRNDNLPSGIASYARIWGVVPNVTYASHFGYNACSL